MTANVQAIRLGSFSSRLVFSIVAIAFAGTAHSAIIAGYQFEGPQNGVDTQPANTGTTTDSYLPSVSDPNVTASRVTSPTAGAAGSATVRLGALSGLGYSAGQGNVLLTSTQGIGDTVGQYFTVTLTPDSGYAIDFQDLTLQAARSGGSDRGFRVRSSLDGYTADLNSPGTTELMNAANGATQRPTLRSYTIDLSAAPYNAVSSPIEFRFYPWSSAPNNTIDMDNFVFNGEVVPEPGTLALLAVVAGGWMFRRRQREV